TAEEIAAVINANAGTAANGLQAIVEGEALFVQGLTPGAGQSLLVNGGSSAATFGWTAPTTVVGSDVASEVTIGGAYSGDTDQVFTFQPMTDGTIGTTPGLMVEVRNENGLVVARLDVGEGYEPGTVLDVEDGITVSFGFGELSATNNDRVSLDLIADGDSSDVLVAMGINSLFTGSTAGDLSVREDLLREPERLSVSATGAPGDNGIALALENLGALGVEGLNDSSLGEFWGEVTGEVGFETAAAGNAIEVEAQLVASLEARREQVSGVNVDEELVNMIQYEQAFAASSQFIQVVNGLNDDLLSLV
ncbi:MAG: flagellar basal body rod C-terminal domain-containing protein, partial [Planctomycetota bacterium]